MSTITETLQAIPWFSSLDQPHFEKLVALATEKNWPANHVIFREGEVDDQLHVIVAGQVALEVHIPNRGRVTILTIGPHELFGWSAVVPVVQKKTASARAVHPTQAIAFNGVALRQACEADHDLGYYFFRRMTNVVAGRLSATRMQLLDMYAVGGQE